MDRGTYALIMALRRDTGIDVGRLGRFSLPAGYYAYCGSALGGLQARIERHRRRDKRPYWHIDYLTRQADIVEVWYLLSPQRLECYLCEMLRRSPGASIPAAGFGASDCRCPAHLIRFEAAPPFEALRSAMQKRGLQLQSAPLSNGIDLQL